MTERIKVEQFDPGYNQGSNNPRGFIERVVRKMKLRSIDGGCVSRVRFHERDVVQVNGIWYALKTPSFKSEVRRSITLHGDDQLPHELRKELPRLEFLNVVQQNREHPETFHIETDWVREGLQPGDHAKLVFKFKGMATGIGIGGERMWVKVTKAYGDGGYPFDYVGTLDNNPVFFPEAALAHGDAVVFKPSHVAGIMTKEEQDAVRQHAATTN